MLRRLLPLVVVLVTASACVNSGTTVSPTGTALDLSGKWVGSLSAAGVTAQMTWTVIQTNNTVSGPVLVVLPNGVVLLNGTLSGIVTGPVLTYTIAVAAGGIPTYPACTGQLGGAVTATIGTTSTLAGSYALAAATCPTPFSSGTFTLTR